ncbi:hypothetical protein BpHYR1_018366 [Brachionus plicatilis]|uniref:Uncharacterized protein n=1 Tax=Brachionus plicatilis TaxID=10195 RepID=A0A3M7PC40_BRAPC|nr:hypothetical protein BpHYR1_018366 [Brachionus plicatilis]
MAFSNSTFVLEFRINSRLEIDLAYCYFHHLLRLLELNFFVLVTAFYSLIRLNGFKNGGDIGGFQIRSPYQLITPFDQITICEVMNLNLVWSFSSIQTNKQIKNNPPFNVDGTDFLGYLDLKKLVTH